MRRPARNRVGWVFRWLMLGLMLVPGVVQADRLVLRGGGILEGVILPESARKETIQVLMRSSSKPFEIPREKILEVQPVEDALRTYLKRRQSERDTAEEEFSLGAWCETNGLTGPAQIHFQKAVELDPSHAEAQKKLGHVLHDGRWMTYDELRKIQGLVKYKGKWITPKKKAEQDAKEEFSAEQKSWVRRLKVLRQKWLFGDLREREQAEQQIQEIRDPAAVAPLVYTFGADAADIRIRLAGFVGAIEGPAASSALARLILSEPVLEVREATLAALARRDEAETVPRLISALKASDPLVVGRAAWALAGLQATEAVPRLIPVLVKVEQQMVYEPQASRAPAVSTGFGSVSPGFTVPTGGALAVGGATGMTPPATYMGGSIPVVTGPVMGPGVVAFGATSVPFGSFAGMGVGGGVNPNRPAMSILTRVYQNEEVLNALRSLTGMNFGYDIPTWKQWLNRAYQPRPTGPVRRVPQP